MRITSVNADPAAFAAGAVIRALLHVVVAKAPKAGLWKVPINKEDNSQRRAVEAIP